MSKPVLSVNKLTKVFGSYTAVDQLSFEIESGEIFGLLGPNGAGKSTTIQMLLGQTTQDAGSITYFGKDFNQNQEYCLQRINHGSAFTQVQGRLTVRQNLYIFAHLYQIPNVEKRLNEVIELLEIEPQQHQLFWHLSSGQRTRVMLAKALLNKPKLLLLDEPTASLDPDIVNKIVDLIRELKKKEQVSILFTSHNMEEITRLCDRVLFMHLGKKIDIATPQEFTKRISTAKLTVGFDSPLSKIKAYSTEKNLEVKVIHDSMVEFNVDESQIPSVLFDLKKKAVWVTDIDIKKPTMEDVFLSIAKGGEALEGSSS